jgi:hypothetical protein
VAAQPVASGEGLSSVELITSLIRPKEWLEHETGCGTSPAVSCGIGSVEQSVLLS